MSRLPLHYVIPISLFIFILSSCGTNAKKSAGNDTIEIVSDIDQLSNNDAGNNNNNNENNEISDAENTENTENTGETENAENMESIESTESAENIEIAGNTDNTDDAGAAEEKTADNNNNDIDLIQKAEVDIVSYNYLKKKKTFGSYDAYSLPDSGLRIVCQQPCAIPEDLLKKKLLGAKNAVKSLLELTVLDILPNNKPTDIHVTSSAECGNYDEIFAEFGYVARFFGIRFNNTSYMCLWEYNDDGLVLPLNDDNAQKIEAQQVLIHEYSHIIFDGRTSVFASKFEDFVKALSFYVSGHWDGNGLEPENFPKVASACDPYLEKSAKDVYELCTKCGFSFNDISVLLQKMDEANAGGGMVDMDELKIIFDGITGKNTANECGLEWLN
ncbi:MAG: hypothetical protein HYT75_02250 [Deltaproteobacteria bacterium]|nr:hypothetical protein [Deltaproteobacteria bacterium]